MKCAHHSNSSNYFYSKLFAFVQEQNHQQVECSNLKKPQKFEATHTTVYSQTSEVLVVFLKRHTYAGRVARILQPIVFDVDSLLKIGERQYLVVAIQMYHPKIEHYTMLVRETARPESSWFHYDDEVVSEVCKAELFVDGLTFCFMFRLVSEEHVQKFVTPFSVAATVRRTRSSRSKS